MNSVCLWRPYLHVDLTVSSKHKEATEGTNDGWEARNSSSSS